MTTVFLEGAAVSLQGQSPPRLSLETGVTHTRRQVPGLMNGRVSLRAPR